METFDFQTLITILITIIMGYLTIFLNLKKELDDLRINSQQSKEIQRKIFIRKRNIKYLHIVTLVLLCVAIILYMFPSIINALNDICIPSLNQNSYFHKLLPFKEGFFENRNFRYSFITGIILSVFIQIALLFLLLEVNMKLILKIVFFILFFCGQIWADNFISLFLETSISKNFGLLSIVINFVLYIIIFYIGTFIIYIFSEERTMGIRNFYKKFQ